MAELWREKMTLLEQSDPRFGALLSELSRWEQVVAGWLGDARCAIFVAEQDGRLCGCVIGWLQVGVPVLADQLGVVSDLLVDTHAYHGGLGRSLAHALRDWFQMHGVRHIVACAPHFYAVEQAFWRALGATQWIDLLWVRL